MSERKRIGPYEIVRLLGKGGMSEVYEVENPRLGSRHALKLFAYEKDDADVRERFLAEGRLLAKLSHPRIVKVTDVGTADDGRPFFVMDLVRDERGTVRSLADIEPGTADEDTVGRWYDDLREGLAYIHVNGIVHRDLKLQNVLIGPDEHAVLTDFGISKVGAAKGDAESVVDTVKTLVKMRDGRSLVMGSVGYMAPELEMGVEASPQSDYYALGVIVYRLLTGTWCDARTDVAATLETYDPVWRRILPKLLHSNPNGRECLPYAAERQADREKAELDWEERWLKEKSRGHLARHVARYVGLTAAVFVGALCWQHVRHERHIGVLTDQLKVAEGKAAVPSFSDVCKVPAEAKSSGRNDFGRGKAALIAAWVLTHEIFEDLRAGKITREKAVEALESLVRRAETNYGGLFGIDSGYMPACDPRLLKKILDAAVQTLKSES